MKTVALALALLAGAAPAAAQQASPHHLTPEEAARVLANPLAQDLIARQIASLVGIILDTKVGPLAALTDPRDGVRSNETLRSVEQRSDPDLDRHVDERSHRAVAAAGAIAGAAVTEASELRRTTDHLRAALAPLVEEKEAQTPRQ